MPSKYYRRNFKPQHYYHIFNRGAYKHKIFKDKDDYKTFTSILSYYLKYPRTKHFAYQKKVNKFQVPNLEKEPTIHLVAYCQMPNHFHLLLKQLPKATQTTNISNLMRRLSISYSIYFGNKYKHTGSLFEGKFKNVEIISKKQLLHLSEYIHRNPIKLVKELKKYSYSSLPAYLNQIKSPNWLYPKYVTKLTKNYNKFISRQNSNKNIKEIESLTLE